jgi:hypothetical protein
MTKLRKRSWDELSRAEKLANVIWSDLASPEIREEMRLLLENEKKQKQQQVNRTPQRR